MATLCASRSSLVRTPADPVLASEMPLLERPQPLARRAVASASVVSAIWRRFFFMDALRVRFSLVRSLNLSRPRCASPSFDERTKFRPLYFTFSSLGNAVFRGASIDPSLFMVKTMGLGIIIPKSPRAIILSPSIL
jgi:hypothetical protein